jgi:hypothetical protein
MMGPGQMGPGGNGPRCAVPDKDPDQVKARDRTNLRLLRRALRARKIRRRSVKPRPAFVSIYTRSVVATAKALYSVHPSVAMTQKWVATLKEKTGRSLDEWLQLVKKSGLPTEKERREWLKSEHGLPTMSAWWIAERAGVKASEFADPEAYLRAAEQYVDAMFSGKEALRPIYDALLKLGLGLGKDVKACPCQTMVPLYRKHVFAQIKPTTRTPIDMGFAQGARPAEGRLIDTGGFAKKDRITHRIPISSLAEIDDEVKQWLRTAFEEDR